MADYSWWQRALAGGEIGSPALPVHDGDPQPGFYRRRTKRQGAFIPVAIWPEDGRIVALCDGEEADASEIWTYCCQHPVSEEAYRTRSFTGKWPDEDGAVSKSLEPPPAGHNNAPTDDAEILKEQIDAASAGVADYAEIADDAMAAKAQSLRSRLLELSGEADTKREAEKRPHLEAGRVIDAKFQPLIKAAKAAADTIRAALGAFETRKAKVAEAARVARVEAERLAALKASPATGDKAVLAPSPPVAPEPPPTTAIKGAYGRAATVKVVKVATVTNIDAAYGFLKTHKELVELIGKLAQRAVEAGYEVPGVEVTEKRDVR